MKDSNSIRIINKCGSCELRDESFFCNFSEPTRRALEALQIIHQYEKSECLFIEGQPTNGIYMLCSGRVKLSTCSKDGRVVILHIAKPGEVLGLSSLVSVSPHIATAEALEPCQVNFFRDKDFLHFLEHNSEACLKAVRQLSKNYNSSCLQICALGLSATIADKLATLILNWCRASLTNADGIHLKINYTHEELAQMIGTTRETVTRLLKNFRDRNLIKRNGREMSIPDMKKLEAIIGTKIDLKAKKKSRTNQPANAKKSIRRADKQ